MERFHNPSWSNHIFTYHNMVSYPGDILHTGYPILGIYVKIVWNDTAFLESKSSFIKDYQTNL